jgi:hypothetical protein
MRQWNTGDAKSKKRVQTRKGRQGAFLFLRMVAGDQITDVAALDKVSKMVVND